MMNVRIKKYKLRYGGTTFSAGAVVPLPDVEAKRLVAQNSRNFEFVEAQKFRKIAGKKQQSKEEPKASENSGLPDVDFTGTIR